MSTPNLVNVQQIQRILILGHNGYIGSHIERCFHERSPDLEIVGRSFPPFDLTKEEDTASLTNLLDPNTVVIMCAAIKKQLGDNLDTFSRNLKMVMNLCRLLQERPIARFIFFSSAAVYGEDIHNTNITEETPVQPTSYYGIGKYTAERLFRKVITQQESSSYIMLRPALIYGPSEPDIFYGPSGFLKTAIAGQQIRLWGDGQELREFIYIDDIVELVYHLTFDECNGVINIVSGHSYTFAEALEIISDLVAAPLRVSSRARTKEKVDHGFDNTTLVKLFPDFQFTTLEAGLKRTFAVESANK